MARPQIVQGLKPDASVRANAQKIVATRTAEFFGFAPYLANPAYVTQLHDMRIAAKRLRYALEIFKPALDDDTAACIAIVKEFQEIVGEIHDDDVLVEIVRAHLTTLATERARAFADRAAATNDDEPIDALKAQSRAFVTDDGWVAEQAALAALIARTVRDRRARYAHLLTKWEEWRAAGLRERLEALAVDLPTDVAAAPRAPQPPHAPTSPHRSAAQSQTKKHPKRRGLARVLRRS